MTRFALAERHPKCKIIRWPDDGSGVHYGIAQTGVRVSSLELCRRIADTVTFTSQGVVYDYALAQQEA